MLPENLLRRHPYKSYNPDIANALFISGYIESWGTWYSQYDRDRLDPVARVM